ncbi:hypothetical protein GCM10010326_44340 [Streptomyces xanthochromogenes]|uniref:Uncharacterized protein n=1 Tax=Streptomyces xanthochromogenes TaxID=67384 RepID=A0ABQ3AC76_9ACTN|nr:hypothetical protein GCM10010326_44340 [Streptomyces xanthochromogenes]
MAQIRAVQTERRTRLKDEMPQRGATASGAAMVMPGLYDENGTTLLAQVPPFVRPFSDSPCNNRWNRAD